MSVSVLRLNRTGDQLTVHEMCPAIAKGWLIDASSFSKRSASESDCTAQVAPSRETFLGKLVPSPGSDVMDEIGACTAAFSPTLAAVQKYLAEHGLDDPTKV